VAEGGHIGKMRPRKRCPYCRCLFQADARVARRQWACTKDECQGKRRRASQASWRAKHPEDGAARRLRGAIAEAKAVGRAPLPRAPPAGLPWDEVRDEISPQALVIVGVLIRLGVRAARDEIRAQVRAMTKETARLVGEDGEDETAVVGRGG